MDIICNSFNTLELGDIIEVKFRNGMSSIYMYIRVHNSNNLLLIGESVGGEPYQSLPPTIVSSVVEFNNMDIIRHYFDKHYAKSVEIVAEWKDLKLVIN